MPATPPSPTGPTSAPGLDGLGRFVNRRELQALRPALREGETVAYALDGFHAGRRGVLAATDRRLLFVSKSLLRRRVQEWEFDEVARLEAETHIDDATLTLHAQPPFVLTGVRKAALEAFRDAVRLRIADRTFRLALAVADPAAADDEEPTSPVARLQRLDRMRARRSITEPEYKVNRRRILEDAGLPTDLPPPRGRR